MWNSPGLVCVGCAAGGNCMVHLPFECLQRSRRKTAIFHVVFCLFYSSSKSGCWNMHLFHSTMASKELKIMWIKGSAVICEVLHTEKKKLTIYPAFSHVDWKTSPFGSNFWELFESCCLRALKPSSMDPPPQNVSLNTQKHTYTGAIFDSLCLSPACFYYY